MTDPVMNIALTAIGSLTVAWGGLEGLVSAFLRIIRHHSPNFEPESQIALERKLKLLKRAAKALPYMRPYRNEITNMISKIRIHSKIRQNIIHGFVENDFNDLAGIRFRSFLHKDGKIHSNRHSYTIAEILNEVDHIHNMVTTNSEVLHKIIDDLETLPKRKRKSIFRRIPNTIHRWLPSRKSS